jgi:hypothetical protein
MMDRRQFLAAAAAAPLAAAPPARSTEVSIRGDQFFLNGKPTYAGRQWEGMKIEGLLLNARLVQGIFDDLNPDTRKRWAYPDTHQWEPERNTREFLAAMPEWRRHGLLAFTVNLQGGNPEGYGRAQPWENSAITPEGELRPAYMARLERILDRADELGMVAIVGYFYFGQDHRFRDEAAIRRAVLNATHWLLDRDYRNVLVEVNNECNVQYQHEILQPPRVHELIELVKNTTRNGRRLLAGTSYGGGTPARSNVVKASDFLLLHGNGPDDAGRVRRMVETSRAAESYRPMPVLINEDDHFRFHASDSHMRTALGMYVSWGYFDPEGYQCPPVTWSIDSERKRRFFAKVAEITGAPQAAAEARKLSVLIVDGVNNHDWAAATSVLQSILEGTGRFTVEVCTWPALPRFVGHDVVINNFNGGHTVTGTRWPRDVEAALEAYVRGGGGLVAYHAANNAFLEWPAYNDMIGLACRDKTFGPGLAIGPGGAVVTVPKGTGLNPGHGPRHDFEVFVREPDHAITRGLPSHWMHPGEQLTHGQHGPAQGLTILTFAFSEVSHQGEPMDWVRQYGRGRVYTTMLGHTWKDELNPNLDDLHFQALIARGVEWAATGAVTLVPDLGWRPLFNGKDLTGWEPRGDCLWTVLPGGVLYGERTAGKPPANIQDLGGWRGLQAWLYTKADFNEYDLHVDYWIPPHGNSGVSIRDGSRAHSAIGETDEARPDLKGFPQTTPSHIGYEIQIIDDDAEDFPTGSIYTLVPAKRGVHRRGEWNALEIESRSKSIRVRLNGQLVAEGPGDPARPKTGPIGLQLHDRFTTAMFRNLRIREL